MKMVPTFLLCGLGLAALASIPACSGTPTDDAAPSGVPADDLANPMAGSESTAEPMSSEDGMQDPQDPQQALRREQTQFLVNKSLEEGRRALELRLFKDAAEIAAEILEIDPGNEEARILLTDARAAMGDLDASVAREFIDGLRQTEAARQKLEYDVRTHMNVGDAYMGEGRFGDAIDSYERGLLQLRYSPYTTPGSELHTTLEAKLEAAKQARVASEREASEQAAAQSRAELEEEERQARIRRSTRVKRLLEQANSDFQIGRYVEAVAVIDQALIEEPNNANALGLRELAERARHENRMDVLRNQWNAEWSTTFDDLNSLDVPQSDPIVYDLEHWRKIQNRTPLQFADPADLETPEERAILSKLESTRVDHRFTSASVQDWADYYARVTDVTFLVTPEVKELDPEVTTLADFQLPSTSVASALEVIGNITGVKWKVQNGVVQLVTPENAGGRVYLKQYDVRDVVQGVPNRPGVELKLSAPGDEDLLGDDFGDEEPAPTVVDVDKLQSLIRDNIEPDSWDVNGTSITPQRGVLLIRHNRNVHRRIESLLSDLRQAVGIQVDVEARFLTVEDQFLEDIGVDFRGLGNQAASGVPGRGLERNNRSNAGFDDFGVVNPATPGSLGTGTEPGFFFDDGNDGDIMARSENLFDNALGGEDTLDNGGGLSLQYAFLDDAELEVVLRAVSKNERSQLITAPRLVVYNNTRASMSVLRHTSYIRDFDVEIAQAAAVANPVVDVVRDGVVLDVRPVVSADRRFITMEMRPTVMTLQLPIPTFTTTLGVGQPVSIQLPRVTLQRVRTTVTMPDGGTMMLGGMKLAQKQFEESRIPVLGSLPGLSFLFSRKGTFVQNKKILILIRAKIILPDEWEPELGPDELETTLAGGK